MGETSRKAGAYIAGGLAAATSIWLMQDGTLDPLPLTKIILDRLGVENQVREAGAILLAYPLTVSFISFGAGTGTYSLWDPVARTARVVGHTAESLAHYACKGYGRALSELHLRHS